MHKHIWLWWTKRDLEIEWTQAGDEGRAIDEVGAEYRELLDMDDDTAEFQIRFNRFLDTMQRVTTTSDAREPSGLDEIRALTRESSSAQPALANRGSEHGVGDRLFDRLHGAWLGRCAGCLLGKPIEGWRTEKLWGLLRDGGHEMLTDYLWRMDIPKPVFDNHDAGKLLTFGESVRHMPEDDDTNYTTAALALVERNGVTFSPDDVATFWMEHLPILHTCTAERVAYRNFVEGVFPPESASRRNPYREWIGAQIRGDFFGYLAAGNPALAAELAWRDASISHIKNGIYGEMWVAAMNAAAAVGDDIRLIIETGISAIPAESRLAAAIEEVLAWHDGGVEYLDCVAKIHKRWDEHSGHDWCHTISNAMIVALALLYGEMDFERTVTRAVFPCFDTDCNGATAGSIVGMILGASRLPRKWIGIMNDTLHTGVAGYHVVMISDLAMQTYQLASGADDD
jgi:hypothetical protein